MLKRKITYTDFNGTERSENFYFNLTETELMKMEMGTDGGFVEMVNKIIDAKETSKIITIFEEIILKAYGEKSDDGKYFDKSEEISKRFSHTNAYSVLFMELATNADKAAEFINGIIPKSAADKNKAIEAK